MPPPPVAGAPVGVLLSAGAAARLGLADAVESFGEADARPVDVAEDFPVALPVGVPVAADEALPVEADEEAFPELLAVVDGEAAAVPVRVVVDAPGEVMSGLGLPGELVQAQTSTRTSIAKVALLTAASLALAAVPGVIMRTSMKPP